MLFWPRLIPPGKLIFRSMIVATGVAAFSFFSNAAMNGRSALYADVAPRVFITLVSLYTWAFETPKLAVFFHRYPLRGKLRRIGRYMIAGVVAGFLPAVGVAASVWILRTLGWQTSSAQFAHNLPTLMRQFLTQWAAGLPLFWIITGVFQVVVARQHVRELQGQLAQAELQNLKSQLHPHFLFNTLHTISILQRQDVELANRTLLELSDLLRLSLDHTRADRIPVQQELDFLESYLSIEKTRFQERLHTSVDASGEARAAMIPTLLLQPFVENALRHGIAPRASGGSIHISAQRSGKLLELRVEDDGAGLSGDYLARRNRGCGIRNTEDRLRVLYSDDARLNVAARPEGGVAVSITLPYCPL
jgi:two-component system, LytTR family, sensor kinase